MDATADALRVLRIHNRYRSGAPSGENETVAEEVALLAEEGSGVQVRTLLAESDDIAAMGTLQKAALPVRMVWSVADQRRLDDLLRSFRPHVVHLHNPFPLLSPAVVRTAKARGVAVVQSVHNYRHVCPAGTLFRDGARCVDCVGRRVAWPAAVHACYRGSHAQSAAMAATATAHTSTWAMVDRFLAVSPFVRDVLVGAGFAPARVVVKPNAAPDPGPPAAPEAPDDVVFAGRLEDEKGVPLLLEAWRRRREPAGRLLVAGDGPLRATVQAAAHLDGTIRYLGPLSRPAVRGLMRTAGFVVVPSVWDEPFGRVAVESLACGRPVIATERGGLPGVVGDCGWIVPAEAAALADAIDGRVAVPHEPLARRARDRYLAEFSPPVILEALLGIYADLRRDVAPMTATGVESWR